MLILRFFHGRMYGKTWSITRKPEAEEGVIYSAGDRFGGWVIFIKDNHLHYAINQGGKEYYRIEPEAELPAGKLMVQVKIHIASSETTT